MRLKTSALCCAGLLILGMASAAAASGTPPEAAPQEIALEDVGLRLALPADWNLVSEDGRFAALAELPPRQALMMLAREPVEPDDAKDQGVQDLLAELPQTFQEHEVVSLERRKLTEDFYGDVVEIRATSRHGNKLYHTTYLVEGFGERFALTFSTEEAKHAELASTFERIVASFELKGPNPLDARFHELVKADPADFAPLQALLDAGADINALDSAKLPPIVAAVMNRNGLLTRWLLEHGADPTISPQASSLLRMVASPPIRALLAQRYQGFSRSFGTATEEPAQLEIHWVSPEKQLFAGILNARSVYVEEALAAGADLEALEPNYQLPALALTRKLIEEFEELDLDSSRFLPIEALLVAAASDPPAPSSSGSNP